MEWNREELDEMQKDALAEVGNISMGSAATALSQLVNSRVQITTPRVTLTTMKEVRSRYPVPCLVVKVNYLQGLKGENILIIKEEDALIITGLMLGLEPPKRPEKLDELGLSAIGEAMNQMMGSAATAMSDFLGRTIEITPPQVEHKDLNTEELEVNHLEENSPLVQVAFRIEVNDLLDSELLQLIPLDFAKRITSYLLSTLAGEETALEFPQEEAEPEGVVERGSGEDFVPGEEKEPAILEEEGAEEERIISGLDLPSGLGEEEVDRLDLIRDIPVEISAVLGKARVPLKLVTSLFPGDIVSLDRYVGEPVDLYANEQLVAKGEVVLVNGQFGVKITEIFRSKSA